MIFSIRCSNAKVAVTEAGETEVLAAGGVRTSDNLECCSLSDFVGMNPKIGRLNIKIGSSIRVWDVEYRSPRAEITIFLGIILSQSA